MGQISLRRRLEPTLHVDVFEVMLGEEYLMSSLFTAGEVALADLALAEVRGEEVDVVVGGLGLGYTAQAVLRDPRVRTLRVVEVFDEVISWHARGLLPASSGLTSDPRCTLVSGDIFEMIEAGAVLGGDGRVDAVLIDIDHTPRHLLSDAHAPFYLAEGQRSLAGCLRPGGAFGLWSDDPPDLEYLGVARAVFSSCEPHVVTFPNPLTGGQAMNTVYVALV